MITAYNVNARHMLVKGAIGVFPEEEHAYWLVNKLSWILPLMIVFGAIVDVLFIYIYMRFAHPWKDILFYKDKKSQADANDIINESGVTKERKDEVPPEIIPIMDQEGEFADHIATNSVLYFGLYYSGDRDA